VPTARTSNVSDSHAFRLPNDLSEVPPLRDRFAKACAAAGVVDDELQPAMLAFTELVNNSIEHGCKLPSDHVEGWYRITASVIEIEVTDPGEELTAADFTNSDPSEFAVNGRGAGLFLIQAMSDEVHVARAPGGGTTIRIVKRRAQGVAT
jgi:anti-sigma regulatory factor (Ser/Thr protein kinase)